MLSTTLIFGCIAVGLLATALVIGGDSKQLAAMVSIVNGKDELAKFRRVYLPAFLTAMLADWLQGPFVYALYQGYGIDREHNGYLFVAGFGASAIFGTVVGSLADQYGRKKFALLYCAVYFGHCLTKHMNSFGVLTIGRVCGGISTSLLFSVFDSWLVSESQRRGFDGEQLGNTFSIAYFGSSIAAIIAGQLGELAANMTPLTEVGGSVYYGGYISPFDLSNCILILCMLIISSNWTENFGQSSKGGTNFTEALQCIAEKKQVLWCGLICSSFESSMFIFVFNWTPCLMEEGEPAPPFGHIFSCFMIMCMLGSRVFSFLSGILRVEQIGIVTCGVSMLCHATVVLTSDVSIRFLAFLLFEACVGMYFPLMGQLKGDIVPEDMRATIYNLYRLPLNVFVLLPLLLNFSITFTFIVTSLILGNALACCVGLTTMRSEKPPTPSQSVQDPGEIEAMVMGDHRADESDP